MNKWETIVNKYINNELKIIPIQPGSKVPAISQWNKDCSNDLYQILYWYETNHDFNWGLPCLENNIFVLDLDTHDENKNGIDSFKKLCDDLNINEPITLIQKTQSGGFHYIFKSDSELSQVEGVSNAFNDYPGIDLRNRNYILVEPSLINRNSYSFLNNYEPQPMPQPLKEYILKTVGTKQEKKKVPYEKPKEVFIGNRDIALFQYINNLYFKTRLDYDEILLLANHFNEDTFETPLSNKTVKYKVNKVFEKDRGECIFIRLGGDNNA